MKHADAGIWRGAWRHRLVRNFSAIGGFGEAGKALESARARARGHGDHPNSLTARAGRLEHQLRRSGVLTSANATPYLAIINGLRRDKSDPTPRRSARHFAPLRAARARSRGSALF